MHPIFLGKIEKGKLILERPDRFADYLLTLEKKEVEVVVSKIKKDRTKRQNRWYWVCVVGIAAEYFGYLPEEMHDAYKMIFLRCHDEGKPETIRSTTTLTTAEFTDYIEKCRQWAAEQGLVIPDPTEVEL